MGKTKKPNQGVLKNSLEAIQGYGTDVAKSTTKTVTEEFDNFFGDLLGLNSSSESSNEKHGQHGEVEIWSKEKKAETHARAHIEYHAEIGKSSERALKVEHQQALQQIREALAELQQLIKSSKALEMEFADIAVMTAPPEAGKSDDSWIDFVKKLIQEARRKVEDAGVWMTAINGKNKKKGGQDYWSMSKKHGTSFSMSNERSTATSVG